MDQDTKLKNRIIEYDEMARTKSLIDRWFPALGLPETERVADGIWRALANWPADRGIWDEETGSEVLWPESLPHYVNIDHAGDVICDGMDPMIMDPLDFIALAKGFASSKDTSAYEMAWAWINKVIVKRDDGSKPFNLVPVGDLDYGPPDFLIDGLIETETLGVLFGDPKCGKSFVAVDLALCVSTGTEFHGHPVKQGAVIYIAGEGHKGLARRFNAWAQHHGRSLKGVPMFKSERAAQFLDGASAQAVTNAVRGLVSQHGTPALIVVDTLARNFGGGDENSTQEMGQFIAAMDDLRSNWPECVLLIVHHTGHAEKQRARGSMALKGAIDFEYRLEKEGDTLTFTNTAMKDAEPPPDMVFALEDVQLPKGGKSAVLVESVALAKPEKLTPTQRMCLNTYKTAALAHGVWDDGAFKGVHLAHWRAEFYRKADGDTVESKRQAFHRTRKALLEKGKMTVTDDVYLVCDPAVSLEIVMARDGVTGVTLA